MIKKICDWFYWHGGIGWVLGACIVMGILSISPAREFLVIKAILSFSMLLICLLAVVLCIGAFQDSREERKWRL